MQRLAVSQVLPLVGLWVVGLVVADATMCSAVRAQPVHTDAVRTTLEGREAETPTGDGDRAAARSAFERGEAAVQAGEYEEALRQFEEAFRAAPHDVVRFNIAVCLERLGRHREAAREYELAAASTVLDEGQRNQARALAATMRAELGTVSVEGAGAGTPVAADGEQRCLLPCRLELDPGDHEITLRSASNEQTQVVTVTRGRVTSVVFTANPSPSVEPEVPTGARGPLAPLGVEPVRSTGPSSGTREPGWLTWTGVVLAVLGTSGAIGFGIHTRSLHEEYETMPTQSLRDEGTTMRALTNASIAVGALGAILVAIDLIVLAATSGDS